MRLNLGSGPHATAGWVCIDRSPSIALDRIPHLKRALLRAGLIAELQAASWDPAIVRADIRKLPYKTSSAEAIYSSHALEHLYLAEAKLVLREAYRVLQPGGMIRLALPDSAAIAAELLSGVAQGDGVAGEMYNQRLLAFPESRPGPVGFARRLVGGHIHRWQPTAPHVAQMLAECGFSDVTHHKYLQGELPDLIRIETRPNSFFLEARKRDDVRSSASGPPR